MNILTKVPHTLLLLMAAGAVLSSCSYIDRALVYDVQQEEETGIIYNEGWQEHFDSERAYYNNSDGLLNIRLGPGLEYQVIAYMKPNEGGFIKKCNFDLQWCYIEFGGKPLSGWVDTKHIQESQIEYKY